MVHSALVRYDDHCFLAPTPLFNDHRWLLLIPGLVRARVRLWVSAHWLGVWVSRLLVYLLGIAAAHNYWRLLVAAAHNYWLLVAAAHNYWLLVAATHNYWLLVAAPHKYWLLVISLRTDNVLNYVSNDVPL